MYTCTHTHAHTHVCLHKHTWTHTHVFTLLLLHSCYETRFRNADCHLFTQAHTPRRLFDLKNSSQVFDQKKKKKKERLKLGQGASFILPFHKVSGPVSEVIIFA